MSANSKLYDSFEAAGIQNVNIKRNNQKLHCPNCHNERKNKRDRSLWLSAQKGTWKCFHCDWTGGVKNSQYVAEKKKEYARPASVELNLSEDIIRYFSGRGIESRVLQYFKIGETRVGSENWIGLPFYRDKELVNMKKRPTTHKDFRMVADAELIFFNLDCIVGRNDCIITEGEIDAMSLYQCGFFGAVSVPNGANTGQMEYLDNCYDYFQDLDKIILCVDNDEKGLELREELARRLGRGKCWFVEYPEGCKDANDVLLKHGEQGVKDLIKSAYPHPVDNINTPGDYLAEVMDFYHNGFPKGDTIGFTGLDELVSFRPGELVIITGWPNSGKSNFLDQILIRLAFRHGWKHAVISREQWPHPIHATKLVQILSGQNLRSREMSPPTIKNAISHLNKHFFLYGIKDMSLKGILETAKQLVIQHGIKSLTIDPWSTIAPPSDSKLSKLEYTNEALRQICDFKDMYGVMVFLVAHPQKLPVDQKTGKRPMCELTHISGSQDFENFADIGISVYRNKGTRAEKTDPLGDTVTVNIVKVRNFFNGTQGSQTFDYNYRAGTYAEEHIPFECELDRITKQSAGVQSAIPITPAAESPKLREVGELTEFRHLPLREPNF